MCIRDRHVAKTNDGIIDDWQGFSNIDADNNFAMLAVLGYMHEWNSGHLFVGVRNVNEDFFTSDVTALFQNSSEGIFPTVASSYPIANYPYSGLTLYFDVTKGCLLYTSTVCSEGRNTQRICHIIVQLQMSIEVHVLRIIKPVSYTHLSPGG